VVRVYVCVCVYLFAYEGAPIHQWVNIISGVEFARHYDGVQVHIPVGSSWCILCGCLCVRVEGGGSDLAFTRGSFVDSGIAH